MDQALIGLIGVVIGILLSSLLTRVLEIRRRHDRQTDLVIALHAEIVAGLQRAREQNDASETEYASKDDDPFGIADRTDFVFESLKSDPAVLPKSVVHRVVRYYKLAAQSNAITEGLLLPAFSEQSLASRRKYVKQLLDLLAEQEAAGLAALTVLEDEAASRNEQSLPKLRVQAGISLDRAIREA